MGSSEEQATSQRSNKWREKSGPEVQPKATTLSGDLARCHSSPAQGNCKQQIQYFRHVNKFVLDVKFNAVVCGNSQQPTMSPCTWLMSLFWKFALGVMFSVFVFICKRPQFLRETIFVFGFIECEDSSITIKSRIRSSHCTIKNIYISRLINNGNVYANGWSHFEKNARAFPRIYPRPFDCSKKIGKQNIYETNLWAISKRSRSG